MTLTACNTDHVLSTTCRLETPSSFTSVGTVRMMIQPVEQNSLQSRTIQQLLGVEQFNK